MRSLLICCWTVHAYTFLPMGSAPLSRVADAQQANALLLGDAKLPPLAQLIDENSAGQRLVRFPPGSAPGLPGAGDSSAPIDAGPFATEAEAATLMGRWLAEYWECTKLEGGEANTCFEFGGCHRCCWWRGGRLPVLLRFEHVGRRAGAADGLAIAALRARSEADQATWSEAEPALRLRGWLVSFDADQHYAGLRSQPAAPRQPRRAAAPCMQGEPDNGGAEESAASLARLWRLTRAAAPAILTGSGAADDGDEDPAAALFNMIFIRGPFLAGSAALLLNVLLGGGVAIGDPAAGGLLWPPLTFQGEPPPGF